jgi:hypothetical protein
MLFITQSTQYWYRYTIIHMYYMFQLLQSPLSFHLLCLPPLASVYTLGVCWTGVLSL